MGLVYDVVPPKRGQSTHQGIKIGVGKSAKRSVNVTCLRANAGPVCLNCSAAHLQIISQRTPLAIITNMGAAPPKACQDIGCCVTLILCSQIS